MATRADPAPAHFPWVPIWTRSMCDEAGEDDGNSVRDELFEATDSNKEMHNQISAGSSHQNDGAFESHSL